MHSYRSKRPIFWLRLCALIFPLLILLVIAQVAFIVYALLHNSKELMMMALYGMGIMVMVGLLHLICASKSKCPLCRSGPMTSQKCAKHRYAQRLLGSYRLRVVLSVLFANRFRCPYCGESTRLKVRDK